MLRRAARDSQPRWSIISLTLLMLWKRLQVYLAALLWTISSLFIFSAVCELQTVAAYSRWGFTRDWYACVFRVWDAVLRFLLRRPRLLFAFLIVLLMWVFHFRSEVSVRPRYLADSVVWRGSHGKTLVCIEWHQPSIFPGANSVEVRLQ